MRKVSQIKDDEDPARISLRLAPETRTKLKLAIDLTEEYDSFQQFFEEHGIEYAEQTLDELGIEIPNK